MLAPFLLAAFSAAAPAYAAADVGRFTKKDCVAPSDFEQCYAEVEEGWADCVNNNCEGQNIDCINICSCIQTRAQLDCAGAYCWNQVRGALPCSALLCLSFWIVQSSRDRDVMLILISSPGV